MLEAGPPDQLDAGGVGEHVGDEIEIGVTARLRELSREVLRIEEDPAWLYALVEETEQIARELRTLHKGLLGASLARLEPDVRQFAGFEQLAEYLRRD